MRRTGYLIWLVLAVTALYASAEGFRELKQESVKDCPAGQAWLELNVGLDVYRLGCYAWEQLEREQISAKLGGQPIFLRVLIVRTAK